MATTSSQPALEAPLPEIQPVSNRHRWIDLGLVLCVAFATAISSGLSLLFHPKAIEYGSVQLGEAIILEIIALALFLVLFKRQGRRLKEIGFEFRLTDLPKAAALAFVSLTFMWVMTVAVPYVYFIITLHTMPLRP